MEDNKVIMYEESALSDPIPFRRVQPLAKDALVMLFPWLGPSDDRWEGTALRSHHRRVDPRDGPVNCQNALFAIQ